MVKKVKKIYKWEPILKVYMKVMYHKPQVLVDQYTDSDEPSVGHKSYSLILGRVTEGLM